MLYAARKIGLQLGKSVNQMNVSLGTLVLQFFVFFAPLGIVLISNRTQGAEKALWALAMVFTSWLGLVVFPFLAPLTERGRAGKAT